MNQVTISEMESLPISANPQFGCSLDNRAYCVERLKDAELMLWYAAQNGLQVDETVIGHVIAAKHELENSAWTVEIETRFWSAFNHLAQLIQPVSVSSLKLANDRQTASLIGRHRILYYQIGSVLFLIIMLCFQAYWLMGTMLLQDIKVFDEKIDELMDTRKDIQQLLTADVSSFQQTTDNSTLNRINLELDDYFNRRQASYDMLQQWNSFAHLLPSEENWSSTTWKATTEIEMRFTLQIIQLYILPLLYGLLGAFAYVLRNLSAEIKNLTYVVESKINYRLRLQLGALAGLAIGWFIDASISIGSLSPLALAFLAGYSVEVLFSSMDKLIQHFASSEAGKKTAAVKIPPKSPEVGAAAG